MNSAFTTIAWPCLYRTQSLSFSFHENMRVALYHVLSCILLLFVAIFSHFALGETNEYYQCIHEQLTNDFTYKESKYICYVFKTTTTTTTITTNGMSALNEASPVVKHSTVSQGQGSLISRQAYLEATLPRQPREIKTTTLPS